MTWDGAALRLAMLFDHSPIAAHHSGEYSDILT